MECAICCISGMGGGDGVLPGGMLGNLTQEGQKQLSEQGEIVDLYDKLRPSLLSYLICLGLRPQEAEDVIQEAFLRLFRFLHSGGRVENARSWIFRVGHNLSQNLQKRESRLVPEATETVELHPSQHRGSPASPEEQYLHKEQMQRVDLAVSQLPRLQRECLHLRGEGLRYREIAEVLGVSVSTVGELLRRAISRLMNGLYD